MTSYFVVVCCCFSELVCSCVLTTDSEADVFVVVINFSSVKPAVPVAAVVEDATDVTVEFISSLIEDVCCVIEEDSGAELN